MSEQEEVIEKETVDVVHVEPKAIVFLTDPKQLDAISNNDFYPIISFLRHRNATVKEIVEAYPSFSNNPDEKARNKSDKSIYRYLKELKEVNLVDVVGQRVTKGQTATEKIWGRTAKIFYLSPEVNRNEEDIEAIKDYCSKNCPACEDEGLHMLALKGLSLTELLEPVLGKASDDINYESWIQSLENKIKDEIKVLIDKLTEEKLVRISKLPYYAIDQILTLASLMSLFKRKSETLQKFYSVFKDGFEDSSDQPEENNVIQK
jgi:hypothetical protein